MPRNKYSCADGVMIINLHDLRILDPSDTHNNFLVLLCISSIP
jgi:hypothetical protein